LEKSSDWDFNFGFLNQFSTIIFICIVLGFKFSIIIYFSNVDYFFIIVPDYVNIVTSDNFYCIIFSSPIKFNEIDLIF